MDLNGIVMSLLDSGWGECIIPIGSDIFAWNVLFESSLILSYFLNHFTFHVIKGLRMGARALWRWEAVRVVPWLHPCTCLQLVQGLRPGHYPGCLWSPQCTANHTAHAGSLTKAQHCVPLISTMHGQLFLIPLTLYRWFPSLHNQLDGYGPHIVMGYIECQNWAFCHIDEELHTTNYQWV